MEFRNARVEDTPDIVKLLKQSLGESLMPKSTGYWKWKHQDNPFGPSPVVLCWEGDSLIGVRAFMRWEWMKQGEVLRAVRAVDTATHPDHQGKGIFKKLTLSLVNECEKDGDHFVFNTPNGQSKPGYLKMGWNEAGKLPIRLELNRPFHVVMNFARNGPQVDTSPESPELLHYISHPDLPNLLRDHHQQTDKVATAASVNYLLWRYAQVPVAKYVAVADEQAGELRGLLIARIKATRLGNELRIADVFLKKGYDGKGIAKTLTSKKKAWKIDYTTLSGTVAANMPGITSILSATLSIGPIVTVRTLALKNLNFLKNFNEWSPSLGDLELF
jgi:GNAT superfamily N-acetyltransferase